MWQRTLDCLGLAVRVRTNAAEIEAALTGVLRSYAETSASPAFDYLLDGTGPQVLRDGELLNSVELPIDMIPAFEIDLYRHLLALTPDVTLHAGAIVDESGRAIVVAGVSGAGKSTLVRGLLANGFRYLSEEMVAIRPGRRCLGLARALHVDDPQIVAPAGYVVDDYPLRRLPSGTFRLFHLPSASIWRGEACTAAVLAIDHAPDAPDALVRLRGGEALIALWPAIFRQSPEALADFEPAFAGVPIYRLSTSSAASALERVLDLSKELRA